MKKNPFEKYLSKEDSLLIAVGNYIKMQYPKAFWCHPFNEGRRSSFERYKAEKTHIRSGLPDILIFETNQGELPIAYRGMFIELKIKPNRPTEMQKKAMHELERCGWTGDVCYSFDEAKELIDNYLR